jgi:hypothetical protein
MTRHELAQLLRLAIKLDIESGCNPLAYFSLSTLAFIIHPPTPAEVLEEGCQLADFEAEAWDRFLASISKLNPS